MADMVFLGGGCFEIKTKNVTAIIDPNPKDYKAGQAKLKDKIVIFTDQKRSAEKDDAKFVINTPGEFEISQLSIKGIPAQLNVDDDKKLDGVIYRIAVADVVMGVIGNIAPNLSDEQLESLGLVDVLIVPVGGHGLSPDSISATSLVRDIEPKVIVPSHYASSKVTYPVEQDSPEVFAKELGKEAVNQAKFKLSKLSIPEELQLVQLEEQ